MSKRLLQIDSCLVTGSTGRITESVARLAQERGWECYIVHGGRYVKRPSCMTDIQSVSPMGEYLHYAESLLFDNHGLASRRATKRVVEQIKQIKPDVVQLHCVHGYYLNYRILFEYLNSTNIPVVWTFHDCWAFTGHCAHFVTLGCEKWKIGCHDCPLKGDYPKSFVDCSKRNYALKKKLFTANKNLHIVPVSDWLSRITEQSFFKNNAINVIKNGVDIDAFRPIKALPNNRFTIIAVSSVWNENKGLYDYVNLAGMLNDDEELVLVGIPEQLKEQLPPSIRCVSKTESVEELMRMYNQSDVVLSLSKAETFGLTVVEAMACGVPAVVYDNTALPELITKEVGFVVPNGDVRAVYEKICKIKEMGKTYFSKACRERAEEEYDKNRCYEKYISLCESLL